MDSFVQPYLQSYSIFVDLTCGYIVIFRIVEYLAMSARAKFYFFEVCRLTCAHSRTNAANVE